ncbi:MAG: hypothetical protein J5729_05910 [Bacteroidaceae bacterium]|nr:hypothetical protein [Bacteroidaceae bacterium]
MKHLALIIALACAGSVWADRTFREDVNADNAVNSADVVSIYNFIFGGAESGYSLDMTDVNGDGLVNAGDVVQIYNSIITGKYVIDDHKPHYETASGTLRANNILRLSEHYIRKNSCVHAEMRFANSQPMNGALFVGRGYDEWYGTYLKITHDSVHIFRRTETDEIHVRTEAHGLTITDSLSIAIICNDTEARITLRSNGRSFSMNNYWNGGGATFVLNQTDQPIETVLRYSNPDYLYDIWMLGDSYLSYSANRWMYHLYEYGYTSWLADHRAGVNAAKALEYFKTDLQRGTPRFALWLIGMNDGKDTDTPRSQWLSATKEFIALCKKNGITPILQTIPNTSTKSHQKKTEWIRTSGYRYIDLAAAVGSQPDGTWAEGMRGPDGIHPTIQGAKAMAEQVVKDFPEIAQ